MNLNQSETFDTPLVPREHEATIDTAACAGEATPSAADQPKLASNEPSPSERLYEAYRLWAFTGR